MYSKLKHAKKWLIKILVFWGIFKILFFLLKDVLFQTFDIPDPYNNIIQMASLVLTILISLILTVLLVKESE
ncbi:hypothetical protein D3C78_751830 [compost metagenome]